MFPALFLPKQHSSATPGLTNPTTKRYSDAQCSLRKAFAGRDTFESRGTQPPSASRALQFSGGSFKKLVKDFKKLDGANLTPEARRQQTEAYALQLFTHCKTKQELQDFAKQTGIVIHNVETGTPLAEYMAQINAQGLALYPPGKIAGLPPRAIQQVSQASNKVGFEIVNECETQKKPLVLIRPLPADPEFELYVLKHELYHIIQQTLGLHCISASNYENEALASPHKSNLLKKLLSTN